MNHIILSQFFLFFYFYFFVSFCNQLNLLSSSLLEIYYKKFITGVEVFSFFAFVFIFCNVPMVDLLDIWYVSMLGGDTL